MSENYVLGGSIVYNSTTRTYKTAMRDNRTKTNRGYLLAEGCVRGKGYFNDGDPEHVQRRMNANLTHGRTGTAEVWLVCSDCDVYGYGEHYSDRPPLLLSHNGSSDCSLTKAGVPKVIAVDVG